MVPRVSNYFVWPLLLVALLGACQSKSRASKIESSAGGEGGSGGATANATAGKATKPPTGDGTCSSPVVLSGARALKGQATSELGNQVSAQDPSCLGTGTDGPERVYQITIPSRSRNQLRVTITPEGEPEADAFDPVLYISKSCDNQPSCLMAKDSRGGGSPEVLSYVNESADAETLYVIVDGYGFQSKGGKYKMEVELVDP